jgi:anti-sigma regulatory factor (Ser/Thr protein kinase)
MTIIHCGNTRTIHYHAQSGTGVLLCADGTPRGLQEEARALLNVELNVGDLLFFYSDGPVEARSPEGELFSDTLLLETVKAAAHLNPQDVVEVVAESVRQFTQTQQLDDELTCIAIRIEEADEDRALWRVCREFTSDYDQLEPLRQFISGFCRSVTPFPLDDDAAQLTVLATNEAVTNIIKHAYQDASGQCIQVAAEAYPDRIELTLTDWGRRFNSTDVAEPAFDGTRDNGFGLYIMDQCMDRIEYLHDELGRNCLRLTKNISQPCALTH